jgi:very-short-patch-repair endonuclease
VTVTVERAKQVFQFLKAFSSQNVPLRRRVSEHHWSLSLSDLPAHPAIVLGEVHLSPSNEAAEGVDAAEDKPLLTIGRPSTTASPTPPEALLDFLAVGWRDPENAIEIRPSRDVIRDGATVTERFDAVPDRVQALSTWRVLRDVWAATERPARRALRIFDRFFELKGRIDRESESVELILGDGRLRWNNTLGGVDHPVLLQRVELIFDAHVPEFRVVEADRGPELHSAILQGGEFLTPQQLHALRTELELGGYHPLARDGTEGFLRQLVQMLAPDGLFDATATDRAVTQRAVISRAPVLYLRDRPSGFPAAFDRVLEDLDLRGEVPASLTSLVGVEPPTGNVAEPAEWSPWGEPPDVLLSKPANDEQIHIAHALERHKAVLVQGPPGTGKSHTIANLIGHLVAHGKRVLVTSHTTKALRVLRGQIVDTLKPLCVALLENDLEGRSQMEEAVKGILTRLTRSTEAGLEREVVTLTQARAALSGEISKLTRDLRTAREGEYSSIVVGAESIAPSQAASWIRDNREGNDWIPSPIEAGAPLPLSPDELGELYETNGQIDPDEESEIEQGIPPDGAIPTPEVFRSLVGALNRLEPRELNSLWEHAAREEDLPQLRELHRLALQASEGLARMERWQRTLVAAGHAGGADAELWMQLVQMIDDGLQRLEKAKLQLLQFAPQLPQATSPDESLKIAREIEAHLQTGASLSAFNLLFHAKWKTFLQASRCNGHAPMELAEMRSLRTRAELELNRHRFGLRWQRQATPIGLPELGAFGADPELKLTVYAAQFAGLLSWWSERWPAIASTASAVGLRWIPFRDREVARSGPMDPFERDVCIIDGPLPEITAHRIAAAERVAAQRILDELEKTLTPFRGQRSRTLLETVRGRDSARYAAARERLSDLEAKIPILQRRTGLLDKLGVSAAAWSRAILWRVASHTSANPPGVAATAWKWRQLHDEIERRTALDEVELILLLHQGQKKLRSVTTELIDRRAWLGQVRRTDLRARQSLQGWAQIQKLIGKGTGKRVPALQAEARRLLGQARDAVPVWIMPLSRVAESFDATKGKFDVVILDEASQSNVTGLLAWYLGDRVVIVGDHEQVSPLAVGEKIDNITDLISRHLNGVPNAILYGGKLSVYDLARQCFGGTIALREHFRCVPDIIDFSNYLSYNGEIRPLRDPTRVSRPHVVECVVDGARLGQDGKRNLAEARLIVAVMKALTELSDFSDRTMGMIALVGDEQAGLVQDLALQVLGAVELDRRRFVTGSPAQFQGDERDIMFLSMVDTPIGGPLRIRQDELFKQRFNVAASRARDQMWLFHSLDPDRDLQTDDLRRRLIEHVRNPGGQRDAHQRALERAESPFERSVLTRLIAARYRVTPQVWVGRYRLDIVVSDDADQVVIECDGDRFHGLDQIPDDMARQAVLERSGWRFIRVRGTRFYRDPDKTMEWVFGELARLGIKRSPVSDAEAGQPTDLAFRDGILRRAWEIMRDQGWTAPPNAEVPNTPSMTAKDVVDAAVPAIPRKSDLRATIADQVARQPGRRDRVLSELRAMDPALREARCPQCAASAHLAINGEGIVVACTRCKTTARVNVNTLQRLAERLSVVCFSCKCGSLQSVARSFGNVLRCPNAACPNNTWQGIAER